MTLVRRYFICAVLCAVLRNSVLRNSSRTRCVRSRCMRDARPSLFIFAVLSAVLRSGFRDTAKIPQNMSVAAAVTCPILGLLSTYMPNQRINMAQTETHSKILPSPYIGLYCCCFFLERLFIRGSNTEYDHTVDQHTVSSRSVSSL